VLFTKKIGQSVLFLKIKAYSLKKKYGTVYACNIIYTGAVTTVECKTLIEGLEGRERVY